jgi:hypothetical protein
LTDRPAADLADAGREVEARAVGPEVAARVFGDTVYEPDWAAEAPEREACAREAGE